MGEVNPNYKDIGHACTTNSTNPAASNGRVLVFSDYTPKYFNYLEMRWWRRIPFLIYGLSGYSREFVQNDQNPPSWSGIGVPYLAREYWSVGEVMNNLRKDDPAGIIVDLVCFKVRPKDYNLLLDSLVEENKNRVIIVCSHPDSTRNGKTILEDCKERGLQTIAKGKTWKLARIVSKELKRYEVMHTAQ